MSLPFKREDKALARRVLLTPGSSVVLEGVSLGELSVSRRRCLAKLVDATQIADDQVLARPSTRLIVGRTRLGPHEITVASPMPSDVFVRLIIYAFGGRLSRFFDRDASSARFSTTNDMFFLELIASLLIEEAEQLLKGHIAQGYERKEISAQVLRGSIIWNRNFGRHPSQGLICRVFELSADQIANQLVLAGIERAAGVLRGGNRSSAVATQLFIWKQIASSVPPAAWDFDLADRRITRLTEHYRPALALARAMCLGTGPIDLDTHGDDRLQNIEFSLPVLFEQFLVRLLTPYASSLGLRLEFKAGDCGALQDQAGARYREVEPDISVWKGNAPVGVLDAKFKPRYVEQTQEQYRGDAWKVTNEDIYQLFFYQARLQSRHEARALPRAAILAPLLSDQSQLLPLDRRRIFWRDRSDVSDSNQLSVLAVPLEAALTMLLERPETDVVEALMPEVSAELRFMAGAT